MLRTVFVLLVLLLSGCASNPDGGTNDGPADESNIATNEAPQQPLQQETASSAPVESPPAPAETPEPGENEAAEPSHNQAKSTASSSPAAESKQVAESSPEPEPEVIVAEPVRVTNFTLELTVDADGQAAYVEFALPLTTSAATYTINHSDQVDRLAVMLLANGARASESFVPELESLRCWGDMRGIPRPAMPFGYGTLDLSPLNLAEGQTATLLLAGRSATPETITLNVALDNESPGATKALVPDQEGAFFSHELAKGHRCEMGEPFAEGSPAWAITDGIESPGRRNYDSGTAGSESLHFASPGIGHGYEILEGSYTAYKALGSYSYSMGDDSFAAGFAGEPANVKWSREGMQTDAGAQKADVDVLRQGHSSFSLESVVWPFDLSAL